MSLEKALPWSYKSLDFKGYSIAGQTTSVVFNNAKICFDIAQGLPFHMNSQLYCITHLHADHGSGLNYLLSQRSLFNLPQANIMLPQVHLEKVQTILKTWMEIEGFEYKYNLIPSYDGALYQLNNQYAVRSFPTTHRIASFGYIVYECKKKLKPEFQNLERQEILDLKSKDTDIHETLLDPIIAFTGDTQIEFLGAHPDIKKAKVLFVECTYLDEKRSVERAREWGHTHLDEITPHLNELENEHISLIHLSARYSTPEAVRILKKKLNEEQFKRVSIFPRPF